MDGRSATTLGEEGAQEAGVSHPAASYLAGLGAEAMELMWGLMEQLGMAQQHRETQAAVVAAAPATSGWAGLRATG
jgi:hypothetical protein